MPLSIIHLEQMGKASLLCKKKNLTLIFFFKTGCGSLNVIAPISSLRVVLLGGVDLLK